MFGRVFNSLILDPMKDIDGFMKVDSYQYRSPTFKAIFSLVSSAVLLCLINFLVLDYEFQTRCAGVIVDICSRLPNSWLKDEVLSFRPLFRHISWSLGCTFFYFFIPACLIRLVFREPLSDFGFSVKGFFKHLPIYLSFYIIVAIAVALVSYTEAFQNTYPFYHEPSGILDLFIWECFYCLQFFSLEFFFRGYMIHSMKHRMGMMAIFAMVVPYCMIHFQKPFAEALAAIIAGTVLGVLSLRTNTIWGGVFIHSAVAVTMDIASLIQRSWEPS